ncbi:MAG: VapC toxin family PIN domain ribonuclease [Thermoprotei archaeon]|nr:MAG: VapC toxin family PIN domain ribonuclease [Thermoprotei archaeon]
MRQKKYLEKIYVDVNVLYYYLTAHPLFGEKAKSLLSKYSGMLSTSVLTVWLLYVLTGLENIDQILSELEIELLPLTANIISAARNLKKPRDFEDRIHLATMLKHNVHVIISNDRDFDDLENITRIF